MSEQRVGVRVTQGAVRVGDVLVVREGPGFFVLEAELGTSNATILPSLSPSVVTLDGGTELRLVGLGRGDWRTHARVSRYTLVVTGYTRGNGRLVHESTNHTPRRGL